MNALLRELSRALAATAILSLLCCGAYPLLVTVAARVAFPDQAKGSVLRDASGTIRGSRLLAQPFLAEGFFHPRPSAAGTGHDALASGGSNLGPTSERLRALISERVLAYRQINGLATNAPVPADAVTASASGLDPHISVANALLQAPRVAKAHALSTEKVLERIRQHTTANGTIVNVVTLNAALP